MIRKPLAALALSLAATLPAHAETYRVDLIVFVDQFQSGNENGNALTEPNLKGAIEADDAGRLRTAGIEILPDNQFGLAAEWQHLRNSKQFKPLVRIAWTQKDPPGERGPSLHVRYGAASPTVLDSGAASTAPAVDGTVALLLNHYLHLDADLRYIADGAMWPLDERRKMKRDEVHHLDSARLGILARVTKAGASGADSTAP